MSAPRQVRNIIRYDLIVVILILAVTYKSESRSPDVPLVTLLQCKSLPSHEFPLFDNQGSYARPRGTPRTSLNEHRLFLVCTDRVSHQPNPRADRSQDGRVETRLPAPE